MTQIALHIDCMEYMRGLPDKAFDLAIVDPPYGIDAANMTLGKGKRKKYKKSDWDKIPPSGDYFSELFRVSKNQIIWGGNYFIEHLRPTKCFFIWDKNNAGRDFADCEFAWSSFDSVARIFVFRPQNMDGGKIHNTQKPIALYKWLLQNYAKQGDRILDTHLGSGSSRIAAFDLGFEFVGCELDKDYFDMQEKRFSEHVIKNGNTMFRPDNKPKSEQIKLL